MTWVKICGITNLEDALMAVEAGADALGFVFYEKSPRNVDRETVRQILAGLPQSVEKIAVLVDLSIDQTARIIHSLDLTGAQMVNAAWPPAPSIGMHLAVGLRPNMKAYFTLSARRLVGNSTWIENDLPASMRERCAVILDSSGPEQPGGTGKPFDWSKAAPVVKSMSKSLNVIVAGGLTPSNVAEAMRILHPWGVDVSSSVEASHGKKDPAKVKAFITAVREADKLQ